MTRATRHAPVPRSVFARLEQGGAEIFFCLRLGLVLLASEARWSLFRALRRLEIRQMEKRLDRELRRLGEIVAAPGRSAVQPQSDETELTLRQIDFLRREVVWLEGELDAARRRFLDARRRHFSL